MCLTACVGEAAPAEPCQKSSEGGCREADGPSATKEGSVEEDR